MLVCPFPSPKFQTDLNKNVIGTLELVQPLRYANTFSLAATVKIWLKRGDLLKSVQDLNASGYIFFPPIQLSIWIGVQ